MSETPLIELKNCTIKSPLRQKRLKAPSRHRSILPNIIDGINLTAFKGDRIGLIGANGAGKSTLLRCIAGALIADHGTVTTNGSIFFGGSLSVGLHDERTGVENLIIMALTRGIEKKQVLKHLDALVDFTELGEFIYEKVKHYSDGMKVRLGLSIVLLVKSDILLLDEGLAAGDTSFRRKAELTFESFYSSGGVLVMASHSEAMLKNFCELGLVLSEGKAVFKGGIQDALDFYKNQSGVV